MPLVIIRWVYIFSVGLALQWRQDRAFPLPHALRAAAFLAVLTGFSLGLMLLSWLARWRRDMQGQHLSRAFLHELRRRGLLPPIVLRT